VAKSSRSGLGRGLNSLLGGAYQEGQPAPEPAPRERIEVREEPHEPVREKKAVKEPAKPVERRTEAEKPAERSAQAEKPAVNKDAKPVDDHKINEEKIEIKAVAEREPDEIPIKDIKPNPNQPRTNFNKDEIEELAASIEREGLLQPLLVRRVPSGGYQIIAGERRWQACKMLGMEKVPVRIKEADSDKAIELAIVENVQRSDLNPIEEAYGYKRMMERSNMSQTEVAQAVSKARSTIANALRLLDLPEEAQKLLYEEKITAGHARAILQVPTAEGREKLTERIVADKLSVRKAEDLARLMSGRPTPSEESTRVATPKSYKKVAKALRDTLGRNVRVKIVKGKSKVEIEFEDEEDLKKLFSQITEFASEEA
jgi:ParB family chromosome partitioning protein